GERGGKGVGGGGWWRWVGPWGGWGVPDRDPPVSPTFSDPPRCLVPLGAAAGAELDDPEEHAASRLPPPATAPVAASPRRNCRRPSALPDSPRSDGSTRLLLGWHEPLPRRLP